MFYASRLVLFCLLCASIVLGGCANAPNSFRIKSAETLHDRILFPPGSILGEKKLDLYVETHALQCQEGLPNRVIDDKVAVSNPYWPAIEKRVLHIEVPTKALVNGLALPPPATCLNMAVRPAPDTCLQDWIVGQVRSAIKDDADWGRCFAMDAFSEFASDVSQVLPLRASESGAPREERTYVRKPHPMAPVESLPPLAAPPAAEVVNLLPGAIVCVNSERQLIPKDAGAWVATAETCAHLLDAPKGHGTVVLSRTDTENTFPQAHSFFGTSGARIYEARSWLAVRGALTASMPDGAYLYLYYSGKHDVPNEANWESPEDGSWRYYPKIASLSTKIPIGISPILVAQSEPLVLDPANLPDLTTLCRTNKPDDKALVQKRCFAIRDFASIDVLRPFMVDGHVHYAPSGTLTTDIPELSGSRRHFARRGFRSRMVPIDFDISDPRNAVPLAAGDQFGEQR